MLQRLITTGVGLLTGILVAAAPAAGQTLDKIKQRGVLVVGSKADYKPFGFRDPAGNIVGFEPDLARDVAERLSARLELEPAVSSQPHAVSPAGEDRPDDCNNECPAGAPPDRRHR